MFWCSLVISFDDVIILFGLIDRLTFTCMVSGTKWDRRTCLLASGDVFQFVFRPIRTSWEDWDNENTNISVVEKNQATTNDKEAVAIRFFSGDLVLMHDTCNGEFHHSILSDANGEGHLCIVFKRVLQ
jgi:hypothetical protein